MGPSLLGMLSHFSRVQICNPMDCSPPGFSVQGIFPGKNTGVCCHFLLQGIFPTQDSNLRLLHFWHWVAGSAQHLSCLQYSSITLLCNCFSSCLCAAAAAATAKSRQSCPTLRNPIDGSPPGSPIPGILQERTLEWVAIAFSNA